MGFSFRVGFEKNGLPVGKRDLREPKKTLEFKILRSSKSLVLDFFKLIGLIIYVPIRNFFQHFTAKPKSLREKICFVTGSGRGLGRGICIALAKEGAVIACADINEEANSKTIEILTEMGAKAKSYTLNVANKSEVDALAKRIETELGRVYLIVNNAGILMPHPEPDEEYVRAVFGVNILGAIWTIGAFLPKMKEINDGHIVNISSIGAAMGGPSLSTYSASKAALSTYAQSIRLELQLTGYDNIHVTTVHPGVTNTSADYVDALTSRIRPLECEEVVKLIMDSIKYNRGDVTTNPILYFTATMARFLPQEVTIGVAKLLDFEGTIPNLKEYKDLQISDIISKTNRFQHH